MRCEPSDSRSRPGPEPERLKIEDDPEDALRRFLRTPKPKGGVPERTRREREREKQQGGR